MSASVELKNASVTFDSFYAAKDINVKINGGGFGHSAITLMEIGQ